MNDSQIRQVTITVTIVITLDGDDREPCDDDAARDELARILEAAKVNLSGTACK